MPTNDTSMAGSEAERFCNKCGYFGPDQLHNRPNGSGQCGYLAYRAAPGAALDAREQEPDEQMVMLPHIGAVPASRTNDPGILALVRMADSIGVVSKVVCWDHIAMFEVRDALCATPAAPTEALSAATVAQPVPDDLKLTLLMAPYHLNLVVGGGRAQLLAFGRDVWAAAKRGDSPTVRTRSLAEASAAFDAGTEGKEVQHGTGPRSDGSSVSSAVSPEGRDSVTNAHAQPCASQGCGGAVSAVLRNFAAEQQSLGVVLPADMGDLYALSTAKSVEPAPLPDRKGVYAWVTPTGHASLVLVDKRPTPHSPGGVLNASVMDSSKFYDGCAVESWGKDGRWVLLHDFAAKSVEHGATDGGTGE